MFHGNTRDLLQKISMLRRNVAGVRSILNPVLEIVRDLGRGSWTFIHEEMDPYWGDIADHLAQLCAMLNENAEVTSSLSDTIDTLASHRIDEVVRLLTIVTVLTLPLTLLATIFGMNIVMPFADHPLLFYTVTGLGIGLTLLLIWFLQQRRWL
jgi:magnesium transporter